MEVISRQGRLILRLSASSEALEARVRDLTHEVREQSAQAATLRADRQAAEEQALQIAGETVRLMDALDWVQAALTAKGDPLAVEIASARRDGLRRLAAVGVTEIPCTGEPDGRLHEAVDTVSGTTAAGTPRYHIVSVVRRGWQWGAHILRRASVITAD